MAVKLTLDKSSSAYEVVEKAQKPHPGLLILKHYFLKGGIVK